MKYFKNCTWITLALLIKTATAQLPAFPGAQGFGALATGGRGGEVYHVTNLQDSGSGSFRDAVSKPKRTIVFDVAGVIKIKAKIQSAPDLTVAGQTAPGEGIVVYGNGISFASNSIVRYMRFRGGIEMPRGGCTLTADNSKNVIFDHVSVQWGRWDNLHLKESSYITYQYCLIGESIDPQRFGALFEGPTEVTVHHCLWIDNQSRNPKAKAGIQYINNVVYNWGVNGLVGGHSAADHYQDVINNYFIAGPQSTNKFIGMFSATDHVYHSGNYADLNKDGKLNGRLVVDTDFVAATATLLPKPSQPSPVAVATEDAAVAYKNVAAKAGASLHRDAIDTRIVSYLLSLGTEGTIFKTEAAAGGQGAIQTGKALQDSDNDGIPDTWELKMKLNPKDAADAGKQNKDGYTNIESYFNEWLLK
jgi:pectate lyase